MIKNLTVCDAVESISKDKKLELKKINTKYHTTYNFKFVTLLNSFSESKDRQTVS